MNTVISPPAHWVLWLTFFTTLLAVIGQFVRVPWISEYGFAVAVMSYVALALACTRRTRTSG